jgi:hypothetical protein
MPSTPPPLRRTNWPARIKQANAALTRRIADAYARHRAVLNAEAERVAASLLAAQTNITLTTGGVQSLAAFTRWRSAVEAELGQFGGTLYTLSQEAAQDGVRLGLAAAADMVGAQAGAAEATLMATWRGPDPRAMAALRDIVDGQAFREAVGRFGEAAAERAADVLLVGVSQGLNPRAVGRLLRNFVANVPPAWAETTARTAQLYSYRAASHESYRANRDIVTGWVWWASLDTRTCTSCIAQHGTRHTNDETLNDHHRGRCTPLPIVTGTTWADDMQTGPEWFDTLSPAEQRATMGGSRYAAYNDGSWNWNAASVAKESDIYGPMLVEATLGEMGIRRAR